MLSKGALLPQTNYTLSLTIYKIGDLLTAENTENYNFATGEPPFEGKFTVTPISKGKAFDTVFTISVSDWLPGNARQFASFYYGNRRLQEGNFMSGLGQAETNSNNNQKAYLSYTLYGLVDNSTNWYSKIQLGPSY